MQIVHLLFEPPTMCSKPLCVSYRGVCGATACTGAAAIRYPGSRSPESWKEEQHPTPPPPPPQPDTRLWPPCRGRTWSRHMQHFFSFLSASTATGPPEHTDLITLPLVCSRSLLPQRIQQEHNVTHRVESSVCPKMKPKNCDKSYVGSSIFLYFFFVILLDYFGGWKYSVTQVLCFSRVLR